MSRFARALLVASIVALGLAAGTGQPASAASVLTLGTSSGSMPTLPLGDTATKVFRLTNTAAAAMPLISKQVVNDQPGNTFTLDPSTTCGTVVAARATCYITVAEQPTTVGTLSGSLKVTDAGGNVLTGDLLGGGTTEFTLTPRSSPTDFGLWAAESTSPSKTFTVTNRHARPLSIVAVQYPTQSFSRTGGSCGTVVAASSTCTVDLAFTPPAGSTGPVDGQLSVTLGGTLTGTATESVIVKGTVVQALKFNPSPVSFGQVLVGRSAVFDVQIINRSSAPVPGVVPSLVRWSGGEFQYEGTTCPTVLGGASTCTASVRFSPSHAGSQLATLNLQQLDSAGRAYTVTDNISAEGVFVPVLEAQPVPVAFGAHEITSTAAPRTVTVTNTGNAAATIAGTTVTGPFARVPGGTCGAGLAVGASCTINVTFVPTSLGSAIGELRVSSNGKPLVVSLLGTGTPAVPSIAFSPASVDFGDQPINSHPSPIPVTVSNTGQSTVTLDGSSVSLTSPFELTGGTCLAGAPLPAGGSCTYVIGLPVTTPETYSGRLTVAPLGGATATANLAGRVVGPLLSAAPVSHDFGDQTVSEDSDPYRFTITNRGNQQADFVDLTTSPSWSAPGPGSTCDLLAGLAAGASCTLDVTFRPQAVGPVSGALRLDLNAGHLDLALSGNGILPYRQLGVDHPLVTFGTAGVDQLVTRTATITATGPSTVRLSGWDLSLVGSSVPGATNPFEVVPSAGSCRAGAALRHGESCTFVFTFDALAAGTSAASFTVRSDAPDLAILLGGTATGLGPHLSVTPSPRSFGDEMVGVSSAPVTFTLASDGDAAATLSDFSVPDGFQLTGGTCTLPMTLQRGNSCTATVIFTPTDLGYTAGSAVLTYDRGRTVLVGMSGTGVPGAPRLVADPSSYDFSSSGSTGQGSGPVTFTIANTGSQPATVTGWHQTPSGPAGRDDTFRVIQPTSSCGVGVVVAPGESCTLDVVFTPYTVDTFHSVFTVESDAAPPVDIDLFGEAVDQYPVDLRFDPASLAFGPQMVGTVSGAVPVTLTNFNVGDAHVEAVALNGPFQLSGVTCSLPATVRWGDSCHANVSFAPNAVGEVHGSLDVSYGHGHHIVLPLSGVAIPLGPQITVSPSSGDFGSWPSGKELDGPLTISSVGVAPVTLSAFDLPAFSEASPFEIVPGGTCVIGAPLAVGDTCTATLRFTAPGNAVDTHASVSSVLTVRSDAPPVEVPLTGSGYSAPASDPRFSPDSLTFGLQMLGTESAPQQEHLANYSGFGASRLESMTITGPFELRSSTCRIPGQLVAGKDCAASIVFVPDALGLASGQLDLTYDGGQHLVVPLSGAGIPPGPQVTVTPEGHDYGTQYSATDTDFEFTLTSTGTAPVTISSFDATQDYSVVSGSGTCAIGAPMAVGSSCTVAVRFTAPGDLANQVVHSVGTFTVNSDGEPAVGHLAGLGVGGYTNMLVNPGSHDFGSRTVGLTSEPFTFELTNTGQSPITVPDPVVTGPFQVVGGTCTTHPKLVRDATCTLSVTFAPRSVRPADGHMSVQYDVFRTLSIPLAGEGVAGPALRAAPTSHDFGGVDVGTTSAPFDVTILSVGTRAADIDSVTLDPPFEVVSTDCAGHLTPGSFCTVSAAFSPTAAGQVGGNLGLHLSDGTTFTAGMSGTGVPGPGALSISLTDKDFGYQKVGTTTPPQGFTLTNTGGSPVHITGWEADLPFAVVGSTCDLAVALLPGEACELGVWFHPSSVGAATGTLRVESDAPTVTASLSGRGWLAGPSLSISPASHDFGTVGVGSVGQVFVDVSNTGDAPASLANLSVGAPFGAAGGSCGAELDPGASCSLRVSFQPAAPGPYVGALTITDGATSARLDLSGVGGVAALAFSPASHDFGSQTVSSTSAPFEVTLTNSGGVAAVLPLTWSSASFRMVSGGTCGLVLGAGSSCTMAFTFTPGAAVADSQRLTIAPPGGTAATLDLTGTGTGSGPVLAVDPPSHDFGDQDVGTTSAPFAVTVTNSGDAPLVTDGPQFSGPFHREAGGTCAEKVIPDGASCTVMVVFSPTAPGAAAGTVAFVGPTANVSVDLSGTGVEHLTSLSISPSTYDFGYREVGSGSDPATFTVRNTGTEAVDLDPVTVDGPFQVRAPSGCEGASLQPDEICTIDLEFAPTSAGVASGSVGVSAGATQVSATLSGHGIPVGAQPRAVWTPDSHDFGLGLIGEDSGLFDFAIYSAGEAPLVVLTVTMDGPFVLGQANDICNAHPITNGDSCHLQVRYVASEIGPEAGLMTVVTNAGTIVFSLTGTGTDAVADPQTLQYYGFGEVPVGEDSIHKAMTLTNNGALTTTFTGANWGPGFDEFGFHFDPGSCAAPRVLAPGESCDYEVWINPTGSRVVSTDLFLSFSNHADVGVYLSATGIDP